MAAVEQFLRDTTPPPAPEGPRESPWVRAARLEAAWIASPIGVKYLTG